MNEQKVSFENKKVLVVEDYDLNLEIIVEMLRVLGIEPDTAMSGDEALSKVQHNCYDLVLMDIKMPGKDGFETTKEIRALPIIQPLVIALTASGMVEDREKLSNSEMDGFLIKPVEISDIAAMLTKHFGA